jgi:hypothetical protein
MLCDRDGYLLELVSYIQLNPARLKNSEEPTTYRWNSRGADSGRKGPVAIDTTLVLNRLGDTPSDADKAHRKFIDDGLGMAGDVAGGGVGGVVVMAIVGLIKNMMTPQSHQQSHS